MVTDSISSEFKDASVFKALAFLQYELSFINAESTYVRYEKQSRAYHVYLDAQQGSFQIVSPEGNRITAIQLLVQHLPITDFNAQAYGDHFTLYCEEAFTEDTPSLSPISAMEFFIHLWRPRKAKGKEPSSVKPVTIEALYPGQGYHTCIKAKSGEQTNLLFVLDHESLTPYFHSNCYMMYGNQDTSKLVLAHSYYDIMLCTDYATQNCIVLSNHVDLNILDCINESVTDIILPIYTEALGVDSAPRYYLQKLLALLSLVKHYSKFNFSLSHDLRSFTVSISHSEKKNIAKIISGVMQTKNKEVNEFLKKKHNLTDDSALRSFSQEEVNTGISVHNNFYSITMQYTACNILNLTRLLLPFVEPISVTLQDYSNHD